MSATPDEPPVSELDPGREEPGPPAADEPGLEQFDEMAEAAFRGDAGNRGEALPPVLPATGTEAVDATPLPPLEQLVGRIPADVRATLDDLFRAKFVTVRRMPKGALDS